MNLTSILVIYRLHWTDNTGVDRDICVRQLMLDEAGKDRLKCALATFASNIVVGELVEDNHRGTITVIFNKTQNDGRSATTHREAFEDLIASFKPSPPVEE